MRKKILSLILSFLLVFLSFPVEAFPERVDENISKQLILETDGNYTFEEDTKIIGSVENVYCIEFSTEEECQNAFDFYQKQDGILSCEINEIYEKDYDIDNFSLEEMESEKNILLNQPSTLSIAYLQLQSAINVKPETIEISYYIESELINKTIEKALKDGIHIICPSNYNIKGTETNTEKTSETTDISKETTTEKKQQNKKAPIRTMANGSYTFTYDANGGYFVDPGNLTNEVTYHCGNWANPKYSHTPNISDNGTQNGNYGNSMNTNQIISLPGAVSLKVQITYGGESSSYDWACIWPGSHPNYTAYNDYNASLSGKLGGGSHTSSNNTKTYTINGDTVTVGWRTDGSGVGDGYGYYAIITALDANGNPIPAGEGNLVEDGTYIIPHQSGKEFCGWYESSDCSGEAVDIIHDAINEDKTFYAKYQDSEWYKKYSYNLDETTHTIKLTRYNGNEYDVLLPAKAIINGVEYSTEISGAVYQNKTNISSITFDEGIKGTGSLASLFAGCSNLTNLKLRDFNTSQCTNMANMFSGCSKLRELDVSHFNTENVTNMTNMFHSCHNISSLNLDNFNTENVTNMSSMFYNCPALTSLNCSSFRTDNVTDMTNMFASCTGLTSLDISSFNTENVTNMGGMFSSCSKLTSLDLSHFNVSNVESMASMFSNCSKLTALNLTGWDTSNVKNMASMFYQCTGISNLDVSSLDTENVENMASMFSGCTKLTKLNLSTFDTGNVTNMQSMFSGCTALTSVDVSSFDTSKVTNMSNMFYNCQRLQKLDLSNFDTSRVSTMSQMFYNCFALTSLDVQSFDTHNVTNMSSMFNGCRVLPFVDVSGFDTSRVTTMENMFNECYVLNNLDTSNFDTGNVTTMRYMFKDCRKLSEIPVSAFDTSKVVNMYGMFYNCYGTDFIDVTHFDTSKVTDMRYMFYNCNQLTEMDCNNFNTSNVTSMDSMFGYCSKLETLDLHNFNTSKVTSMQNMFVGCTKLKDLDIHNFNTSKVTNMSGLFSSCSNLETLDIGNFNTSNVTNMSSMFSNCSKLKDLDVSNFNTSKVTNMSSMFSNCSSLTELDIDNFNTANVTSMNSMFSGCSKLEDLDVTHFNTAKVTNMSYMFSNCSSLTELDVSNFNTAKVNYFNCMFNNCNQLENLDVSGFNTVNATNMDSMFNNCKEVKELDVSNFNTAKVQQMQNMFNGCDTLKEIDASNFNTNAVTYSNMGNMFNGKNIQKISLGPNFKFKNTATFPSGNWFKGDSGEKYSANQLYQQYNSSMADDYYKEFVVNFNGVGGKVDTKTHYVLYESEIQNLPNATKTGYVFDGWYTEKNGGIQIHEGDKYLQENYYAHWTPIHYTLRLNPNGGLGDVKNIDLAYDDSYILNSTTFEKPGYEIYGWNTKQDGSGKSYAIDDEITMMTSGEGDVVTLYAQWSNDWLDITFDSQGGAEVPPKHLVKGKTLGSLYEPAKTGFRFMGWYTQPNGQGTQISASTVPQENATYYAFWEENPVISFDTGSDIIEKIIPYGSAINTLPEPKKSNYTFDGWYTQPNGKGTKITANTIATDSVTYYANWLLQPVFDPDGGIITQAEDTSDYEGKDPKHFVITSFPTASKPGYNLLGWYHNGVEVQEGDEVDLTQGSKIIAQWKPHEKITISFDGNGGSNPSSLKIFKGQKIQALPTSSRSGKKFLGWFTAEDEEVNIDSVFTEDTTLHAKWGDLVTIIFDANGGASVTNRTIEAGKPMNTILGTRRSGYILEGWYDKNGNKLTEETIINKSTTYTARWIPENTQEYDDTISYLYSATWANASNVNVDNVNGNLEFHPTDTSTQTAQLHLRFELNQSVDRTLPVGSVNITVPKYVFENWNGEGTGSNNLSINLPQYPDKRNGMYFSYIEEDDHYVLVNNTELPGGAGLDMTIHYTVNPVEVPGGAMDIHNEYIDGYDYYQKEIPVTFTIDKNMDGTVDVDREIDLNIEMHTRVRSSQSKSYSTVYYSWNNSWGPKPADADDYFYVVWNLNESFTSTTNQPKTYHWIEDTVHDGTVVRMPGNNNSGSVITKHPASLLQDLDENGLVLYNEAVVVENWRSGYTTTHRVNASAIIRGRSYPTGEFSKYASSAHLVHGGQEDIMDDEKEITLPYQLVYDGGSFNADTMPVWTGNGYEKNPRTITFTDGIQGDVIYSSGSPRNKYVWQPDTENIALSDSDYYFRSIQMNLTEYDAICNNGQWSDKTVATDTTQYDPIEIWIRLANQENFVKYKTIAGTNSSTIALPERTVGFKVVHSSDYYATKLTANATMVLKPTAKVTAFIKDDVSEKTTSIIKNIARCTIEDSQGEPFFYVTNRTNDSDSAYKELYELNVSTTNMNVIKQSANNSAVRLDGKHGTQDNPMMIAGYNYNPSGRRKPLYNGVFYDLLPKGTTVDESSIYGVYSTSSSPSFSSPESYNINSKNINKNYYNVEFIENWQNSYQTMMVITVNLPQNLKSTGIGFYYLLHNTYENIVETGTVQENDVAFANIAAGHVIPDAVSGSRSNLANKNKEYYESLERQYAGDIGFAQASTHYTPIDAYSWGFFKSVKTATNFENEGEVFRNGEYTYRLSYSQSNAATSDQLVFYDVLEGGTNTKTSMWHGVLQSIDTKSVAAKGNYNNEDDKCNPIIYYSTKPRNEFVGTDYNLANTETWSSTKPEHNEDITAVAIDCRKTINNNDFIMVGKQAVNVYITMKAPEGIENVGLATTNQGISYARKYTSGVPEDEATPEYADSTVTIKDMIPEVHKTSNPESGTQEAPTLIGLGDEVEYEISVKNKDAELPLYQVVVEDPIPDHMIVNNSDVKVYIDDKTKALPVSDSPRVQFSRTGQNLRFVIDSLAPGETMHFSIIATSDKNHTVYKNQAGVIEINGVEKELSTEITWHETNFWPIRVGKKITGSDELLSGATMKIAKPDGTVVQEWVTANEVTSVNLLPGDYILSEVSPPTGYVKAEPVSIHITHDGEITSEPSDALSDDNLFTIYDTPRKSITIKKQSSGNYTDANDTFDFIVNLGKLEPNVVYPITASSGVLLDGNPVPSSIIPTENTKQLKITMKAGQEFKIDGLPEITYQVCEKANSYTPSYQIYAGETSVIEKEQDSNPLSGLDLTTKTETLNKEDANTTITFSNVRNMKHGHTSLTVHKTLDGEPLQNQQFEFSLYDPNGTLVETVKNNAQGIVSFSSLEFDVSDIAKDIVYTIKEKAGTRTDMAYDSTIAYAKINVMDSPTDELNIQVQYYVENPTPISIASNEFTFKNHKLFDVVLKKTDEAGNPLEGATLQILKEDGSVYDTWNTSSHTSRLIVGKYKFHEAKAPIGYDIAEDIPIEVTNDGKVFINNQETNEVTMIDSPRHGNIKIHKLDWDSSDMEGAVFGIYDMNGREIAVKTTDEKGELSFEHIPTGEYQIIEKRTREGRVLLSDPISVKLPFIVSENNIGNVDTSKAEYDNGNYYFYDLSYQVQNFTHLNLPKTGGIPLNYIWLSSFSLILLGLYIGLKKGAK